MDKEDPDIIFLAPICCTSVRGWSYTDIWGDDCENHTASTEYVRADIHAAEVAKVAKLQSDITAEVAKVAKLRSDITKLNDYIDRLVASAGLELESVERTVTDHFVTIGGVRFDAEDLRETLSELDAGSDITTSFSTKRFAALKEAGILDYQGNARAMMRATMGPEGEKFLYRLNASLDAANRNEE